MPQSSLEGECKCWSFFFSDALQIRRNDKYFHPQMFWSPYSEKKEKLAKKKACGYERNPT